LGFSLATGARSPSKNNVDCRHGQLWTFLACCHFSVLSASSSAAETASTTSASSSLGSDNEDENGDKSQENVVRDPPTHLNHMGNNVLAALMEESPVELEKIASAAEPIALAPWVPDLKVQFDT
jgi:hypothetical protein